MKKKIENNNNNRNREGNDSLKQITLSDNIFHIE
jgi:hypothetical protein